MVLARLYNFIAGSPAVADQVDAELDQLIAGVNAAVPLAGGTMTGALLLSGAPIVPAGAATKGYVDAASTGEIIIRRTANEDYASSAVMHNDSLLLFPAATNTIYRVRIEAFYLSTVATVKAGIALPAGATMVGEISNDTTGANLNGTGGGVSRGMFIEGTVNAAAPVTAASPNYKKISLYATIVMGATAGNVAFQWAQTSGNASPTTIKANSTLAYRALA